VIVTSLGGLVAAGLVTSLVLGRSKR
jgi:hypothetical protein